MSRERPRVIPALVAGAFAALGGGARADWIQTTGLGVRSSALGGAVTARSVGFDAFYTNPAGAAGFERPFVGGALKLLDTRGLRLEDSEGNHDPRGTMRESDIALVPAAAGYYPLREGLVFGLGFGAPFALAGSLEEKSGIHRFNMTEIGLIVTELVPTISYRAAPWLSLGVGLDIVAFKHLRTSSMLGDDYLAPLGVPADADTEPDGRIRLDTGKEAWLPVPPFDDFAPAFDEFGYTLGIELRPTDRLSFGVTYKSEIATTFTGRVRTNPGGTRLRDDFEVDLDMPRHVQGGVAYELLPDELILSADLQWTDWSSAEGIGSEATIAFEDGTILGLRGLKVNWNGNDTLAFRFGAEYRYDSRLSLLAGYVYDPSIFDDDSVDILTYSSDRHLFSLGFSYDATDPADGRGLRIDVGGQFVYYVPRTIEAGENGNLGGLSSLELDSANYVRFVDNTDRFRYGGFIWTLGLRLDYRF